MKQFKRNNAEILQVASSFSCLLAVIEISESVPRVLGFGFGIWGFRARVFGCWHPRMEMLLVLPSGCPAYDLEFGP